MLLLKLVILIILLLIFAEDMRSRSVHWYLFPALALTLAALRYQQSGQPANELAVSIGITLTFITVQLLLVTVYFSIKQKRFINITSGLLGWGDILLLLSIAFYLPILNFMAFYIGSLVLVLVFWMAYLQISKSKQQNIPLAGLQALTFALLISYSWLQTGLILTDDEHLLQLLTP